MTVNASTYRQVMARLATGVTVLTTRADDRHETMTANAVMSVSLDPVLLVVSVRSDCRWALAAKTSGSFAVNVLSSGQESLSRWCASPERHDRPDVVLRHRARTNVAGALMFDEALAIFDCRLHDQLSIGDHDLLVGAVTEMHVAEEGSPLLYFASDYAELSPIRGASSMKDISGLSLSF